MVRFYHTYFKLDSGMLLKYVLLHGINISKFNRTCKYFFLWPECRCAHRNYFANFHTQIKTCEIKDNWNKPKEEYDHRSNIYIYIYVHINMERHVLFYTLFWHIMKYLIISSNRISDFIKSNFWYHQIFNDIIKHLMISKNRFDDIIKYLMISLIQFNHMMKCIWRYV